jgi:Fanconi anemia group M protein
MQTVFNKDVVIFADQREANCRIIHILKKYCEVREKQLATGDYVLSDRVCAERKSSQDFVQSVIDKRLFRQIGDLKANFEKPVLIIEGGNPLDSGINIHPNALRGAMASIAIDYAVPIIWTASQMDTAHQLLAIAKREQIDEKRSIGIRNKKKFRSTDELQEFLVAGIPKISTEKARRLLKHFKTPENIFTASETELKRVDGIGDELARQIRKLLTSCYGD